MNLRPIRSKDMTNLENKQALIDFLNGLNIDNLCPGDYISADDIDEYTDFDSLTSLIDDNNGFNVEIIYYSRAIEYLSNNDASLHESLELAEELGYSLRSLSSEILASLLASQNCREEWSDNKSEIEDFILSLEWNEDETDGE